VITWKLSNPIFKMGQPQARKYKETSYLKEGHRLPIYGIAFNHFNTKDNIFASAGSNRVRLLLPADAKMLSLVLK